MLKPAGVALSALLPALLLLAGCGSDTAKDDSSGRAAGTCTYRGDGSDTGGKKVTPPPAKPSVSGSVKASIATSAGPIGLTLDAATAPCTVNSFVSLAKQGFFDATPCHRLTSAPTLSVLQCGDPTGRGNGGPGYAFDDELTGADALTTDPAATRQYDAQSGTKTPVKTYPAGTLAMANAGPDTNGSQFFLVYADSTLPAAYAVFGSIDAAGMKTLAGIARAGTADGGPDGAPKTPVTMTEVTVE